MSLQIAEEYLSKNYLFKYNEVSLQIEVTNKKDKKTEVLNEDILYIELLRNGIKIGIGTLISLIKTIANDNKYNPITFYFKRIKSKKVKPKALKLFIESLEFSDENEKDVFLTQFIKWLARAYKTAINDDYHNKQCLVFTGGQNIGKTGLVRFLCPKELKEYYAENFPAGDKDAKILLAQNFLINLDELSGLQRKEITELKSIFSKGYIKERLPYDRRTTQISRKCAFLGTTNEVEILEDTTGNVRWLVFNLKSIDWKKINKINIEDIWRLAIDIAENNELEMTREELKENEERNKQFRKMTYEEQLINRYIEEGTEELMTTSEILDEFSLWSSQKLNLYVLGRILKSSKANRLMCPKTKLYKYNFNYTNEFKSKKGTANISFEPYTSKDTGTGI